jgi:hypothetical protein
MVRRQSQTEIDHLLKHPLHFFLLSKLAAILKRSLMFYRDQRESSLRSTAFFFTCIFGSFTEHTAFSSLRYTELFFYLYLWLFHRAHSVFFIETRRTFFTYLLLHASPPFLPLRMPGCSRPLLLVIANAWVLSTGMKQSL